MELIHRGINRGEDTDDEDFLSLSVPAGCVNLSQVTCLNQLMWWFYW